MISPLTIERWLMKIARTGNPQSTVHVQAKFAKALGHDPSYVSRIEGGDRLMPEALRDRWFEMIGLDRAGVDHYLADRALDSPPGALRPARPADGQSGPILFDSALHGVRLAPRQWPSACRAAVASGLPRTVEDFCAIAVEALVVASPADYPPMVAAMSQLPERELVRGVREVIGDMPSRGFQAIDLLAVIEGGYSGPLLLEYFRDLPDPWMLRSVVEAMRRLVERGHVTSLVWDVELQRDLVEYMSDAPSWTSRIELANMATALGPLPSDVHRRLISDADMDVRIAAGAPQEGTATTAVDRLYAEAILPTLDAMPGRADIEDDIARTLVKEMVLGRNRRRRIHAAQALGLSAYRNRLSELLVELLRSGSTELRRTVAQALMQFPRTDSMVVALVRCASTDGDPDVRGRAMWSLMPDAAALDIGLLDRLLTDEDESVRRCAVDLAAAAGHMPGLLAATGDPAPHIAADAAALAARMSPRPGA